MSPRNKKQFQEIRENTRRKILGAGLELFATIGYFPTSISDLAKKAGISKGLIYNYFDSKEALLKVIVMQGMEEVFALIDPNQSGILTRDELRIMIKEMFRSIKKNQDFWKLYFMMMVQPSVSKLVVGDIYETYKGYQAMILNLMKQMRSRDPQADTLFLQCVLDGIAMNFVMNPDMIPLDALENKLLEIYQLNEQS
jgi:AcrR family transcriptional regulator